MLPLTPAVDCEPPAVPDPVPGVVVPDCEVEVSRLFALPAVESSASAVRSPATPSGENPVDSLAPNAPAPARSVGRSVNCRTPAFGSDSTSTSPARPQLPPKTDSMLDLPIEYAGYCATAPLSRDSTSNSTTAPAAMVNGDGARRRSRLVFLTLSSVPFRRRGSMTWYHAASSSARIVRPRKAVENPLPAIDGGLSHHGTP